MVGFNNIEQIIKEQNITRRELEKFKIIVKNYQPNNNSLLSLLSDYTNINIDKKTSILFEKTIDALLESLEYPTGESLIDEKNMYNSYKLVKDSIIEYCTTEINDVSIIIDNVAFLNKKSIEHVEKEMQLYMSSYGNSQKIVNAFSRYSDDKNNINKSTFPEVYIPIFSKAVVEKIKEMEEIKKMEIHQQLQDKTRVRIV